MPAGQHQINWNAQDDRGQVLPSGMYLVRMVSGKAMKIEKVLLQR
jgi:flagellar hook assembly protein FlgD